MRRRFNFQLTPYDTYRTLFEVKQAEAPLWESSFRISHRMVAAMTTQEVYFAGDAAHLHSSLRARGMNLGLEDAWVFSELVRTNIQPRNYLIFS